MSSSQNIDLDELYSHDQGDEFRNKIATVDKDGSRIWLYPKKPKGKFYDRRKILSYILLIALIGFPFIKIDGDPLMLFNILEGKFIIFGVHFTPQDFHIFVIGMLILIVFIVLFTVIFGRVFCGWICPQTIFMEMVFRRIEYWIEGDSAAQRRLDKSEWTNEKIFKKTIKHGLFVLISVIIAHTFLSYIIGVDELYKLVTEPISEHWQGFLAMVIFTIVFYGVFAKMREQVCTTICPYGRLQGVMLDDNSLAVSYDFVRGEPRGKIKRKSTDIVATEEKGDCIDCGLCVRVCPTGIDIRDGVQLECVNCTACMDACDEIMNKVNKPEGLIRIDSYNGISKGTNAIWNKRVLAYSLVLFALIALESFMLITRNNVETLFLRTPGMLFQETEDGYISNLYNYQIVNKTKDIMEVEFEIENMENESLEFIGQKPVTKENGTTEGAIFVKIPKGDLTGRKTKLKITVYGNGKIIDHCETNFLGPN